jgi:branched-chain amino acid transport system permease protein
MHMGIALQLLFTGLGVGSIYALVALGFVLIYRGHKRCQFRSGRFRHARGVFDGRALR